MRSLEVIRLRNVSAAASTANAAVLHMKDWLNGSVDWQAVGLRANGKLYGVPEGLYCSFPCTTVEGEINPVTSLKFEDEYSANRFKETLDELIEEREIVSDLLA
jgi:malate dehydrogenase